MAGALAGCVATSGVHPAPDLRAFFSQELSPLRDVLNETPRSISPSPKLAASPSGLNLVVGRISFDLPTETLICAAWEPAGIRVIYEAGDFRILPDLWSANAKWKTKAVTPPEKTMTDALALLHENDPLRARLERLWNTRRKTIETADARRTPRRLIEESLRTRYEDLARASDEDELLRTFLRLSRKRDLFACSPNAAPPRIELLETAGCAAFRVIRDQGEVAWWIFDDAGRPVVQLAHPPAFLERATSLVASLRPVQPANEAVDTQYADARLALAFTMNPDELRRASVLAAASYVNFIAPDNRSNVPWTDAVALHDALLYRLRTLLDLAKKK